VPHCISLNDPGAEIHSDSLILKELAHPSSIMHFLNETRRPQVLPQAIDRHRNLRRVPLIGLYGYDDSLHSCGVHTQCRSIPFIP
jgi:hypothetical protein